MKKFHRAENEDGTIVNTFVRTPTTSDESLSWRVLVLTLCMGIVVDREVYIFATSATLFEKFPQLRDEE